MELKHAIANLLPEGKVRAVVTYTAIILPVVFSLLEILQPETSSHLQIGWATIKWLVVSGVIVSALALVIYFLSVEVVALRVRVTQLEHQIKVQDQIEAIDDFTAVIRSIDR